MGQVTGRAVQSSLRHLSERLSEDRLAGKLAARGD
jgi:hypothetical protein